MRTVKTRGPSFPKVDMNEPLTLEAGVRWQVACGDSGHWRLGFYSPAETCPADIEELEQHDCPELFMLQSGRVNLLVKIGGVIRDVALVPGQPILVTAPHCGYCPDGPHSGITLVVERDEFDTSYEPFGE
jgi:hypothetical protein